MAFHFIDRIIRVTRNQSITALRYLSSTEQYLKDHFPKFPVMPGVLILESAVQAASWLIRYSEEFAPSCIVLSEVSNVKFGQFIKPGDTLEVKADLVGRNGDQTDFQAQAFLSGKVALRVKFCLKKRGLKDTNETWGKSDSQLREIFRKHFELIAKEAVLA